MPNILESYARKHRRLHPEIVKAMSPFFKEYGWNPTKAKIKIVSPLWGKLSGRGEPTAVFVVRGVIYVMSGALNARGRVRGNSWDLASKVGFSTFAHEMFHVYQHDRDGFASFLVSLFSGMWKSLTRSKKFYDHQFFGFEQEAIKFQGKVKAKVELKDISQFKDMR